MLTARQAASPPRPARKPSRWRAASLPASDSPEAAIVLDQEFQEFSGPARATGPLLRQSRAAADGSPVQSVPAPGAVPRRPFPRCQHTVVARQLGPIPQLSHRVPDKRVEPVNSYGQPTHDLENNIESLNTAPVRGAARNVCDPRTSPASFLERPQLVEGIPTSSERRAAATRMLLRVRQPKPCRQLSDQAYQSPVV